MKIAEIIEISDKELVERLKAEQAALDKLVLDHKFSNIDNPMSIRAKRRLIARINTVLSQRKQNN